MLGPFTTSTFFASSSGGGGTNMSVLMECLSGRFNFGYSIFTSRAHSRGEFHWMANLTQDRR
jgi:hypothetical protein